MNTKLASRGFSSVIILIIIAVLAGAGYWYMQRMSPATSPTASTTVATVTPSKPTCTLTADKKEVQAGVEPVTLSWTSTDSTFVLANRPYNLKTYGASQEQQKLPPEGSAQVHEFDGLIATTT